MRGDTIGVLLVDDHAVLRAGLRALLEAEDDITVVGEAGTGEEGAARADELRPHVVLMDLSMPGAGGLAATRRIAALKPRVQVLVLTMHGEEEYLLPVLEAGASGYVGKGSADHELVAAIRTVSAGNSFLYPSAARILVERLRGAGAEAAPRPEPLSLLSDRERSVLACTAEGFTAAEIGVQLGISAKTVETYRERVMEKLKLHHRSELIRFALRNGLLTAPA